MRGEINIPAKNKALYFEIIRFADYRLERLRISSLAEKSGFL
jgi:hypothetical protein